MSRFNWRAAGLSCAVFLGIAIGAPAIAAIVIALEAVVGPYWGVGIIAAVIGLVGSIAIGFTEGYRR